MSDEMREGEIARCVRTVLFIPSAPISAAQAIEMEKAQANFIERILLQQFKITKKEASNA